MDLKHAVIRLGLHALGRLGAAGAAAAEARGVILTLHHVRPWHERAFAPNRLLEITPGFLDAALERVRDLGFDLVTMDEAMARLGEGGARFAALTADDGYRDAVAHALPVLRRHGAPLTLYATTGFADRTAPLWWLELEEAIRRADSVEAEIDGRVAAWPTRSPGDKAAAFARLYGKLRAGPEERLRATIGALARRHGVDGAELAGQLCLDWEGLRAAAADPLVTIGAHTLTHPMLAKHPEAVVRAELAQAKARLEAELGRPVRHVAYPVGDPASAGPREFRLAREAGYVSGVTTRPGLLYPAHAAHPTALPRVSLNGLFQRVDHLETLLTGLPFLLWNRGRRLNVA